MWRLTFRSFLDPGFPRFPQTCCNFSCFWQIWHWFWTLLIHINTSSEISFEQQNLIITWRARCSRPSLSLWFLRPLPPQALDGCHNLQTYMIYILCDFIYVSCISNIYLWMVATTSISNIYEVWFMIIYHLFLIHIFHWWPTPPN